MNRDDISRMAREAGFVGFDGDNGSLRRFASLVAAAEREACAKVCDDHMARYRQIAVERQNRDADAVAFGAHTCSSAIRSREQA